MFNTVIVQIERFGFVNIKKCGFKAAFLTQITSFSLKNIFSTQLEPCFLRHLLNLFEPYGNTTGHFSHCV
jgi:hypothetical protein